MGDRFFYDLGSSKIDGFGTRKDPTSSDTTRFTSRQLRNIRKTSMARIICDNTQNIDKIQPLVLYLENKENNPKVQCNNQIIPSVDVSHWKQ